MKRGDIVLITFPFSDLSSSKVRPAVVVSSDEYTNKGRDAIFVVISSNIRKPQKTDLLIEDSDPEFEKTGLKVSSLVRTDKIVILDKNLAKYWLGEMGPALMAKVDKMLADVLSLSKDEADTSDKSVTQDENSKS